MQDFTNLRVWRDAHSLALEIYDRSRHFPGDERFGVTSQLRRAASSVAANLAEGCGRGSDKDFARFVQIASGSNSEVIYFLLLARDLGYLEVPAHASLDQAARTVRRQLLSLLKRLRS